jgi:hypothetical protein
MTLDAEQLRAQRAILRGANTVLLGPAGSGKTHVVRSTLAQMKGVTAIYCALASAVAKRFNPHGINTQILLAAVKQFGVGRPHRILESNPPCAAVFNEASGALKQGKRWVIAIDEVGQCSSEHLTEVVQAVWRLYKRIHGPKAFEAFNRLSWLLIGDCERQLPNIEGNSVLKCPLFYTHESGFNRSLEVITLNGAHRFDPDTREFMAAIEAAYDEGDTAFLSRLLRRQQKEYVAQKERAGGNLDHLQHFCPSRAEVEDFLCSVAERQFGPDVEKQETSPPESMEERMRLSSAYHRASYIYPPDHDLVVEVTVSGSNVVATSIESGDTYPVMNRERFVVGPGAFANLPNVFPQAPGASPPELLVHYNDTDCAIPAFAYHKDAPSKPIFRAVGFQDAETGNTTASAVLMYNAQGQQIPDGVKIVVGTDTTKRAIDSTFFYVALTRTPDPLNVLFHPNITLNFADIGRRRTIRDLVGRLRQRPHQTRQQQSAQAPRRRQSSWQLPPAKKPSVPA